jgi:hypothetical protein
MSAQRGIGQLDLRRCSAMRQDTERSFLSRADSVLPECRLSDPGLAADEENRGQALGGAEELVQSGELVISTDDVDISRIRHGSQMMLRLREKTKP